MSCSAIDTELVCSIFHSMELRSQETTTAKPSSSILEEVASKYRSSFVGGKWLGNLSTPGYLFEEHPEKESYWRNDGAAWTNLNCYERSLHMEKIAETLEREATEIAEIESELHSVSSDKFTSDILPSLIQYIRYYAGWAGSCTDESYKPKGCLAVDVRLAEFPLLAAICAIGPALAAGNTVNVVTTTRFDCAQFESLLHIAHQCFVAGLPAGTFNVIITPDIDKPSLSTCAKDLSIIFAPFQSAKHAGVDFAVGNPNCAFSLHGHSYMLVLRHADVEAAAQAFINEAILKRKLSCWPLSEVLVEEHLYSAFTQHLKRLVKLLDPASVPPCTSWEREWWIDTKLQADTFNLDVVTKKGTDNCIIILLGGRAPEQSNILEPELKPRSLSVLPVRSHTEALSIVNSRPRILSASIWTEDGHFALDVASALKMGMIWINQHGTIPLPAAGFGNFNIGGNIHFGGKHGLLGFVKCTFCEIPSVKGDVVSAKINVKTRKAMKDKMESLPLLNMYWGGETRKSSQICFILDVKDKPVAETSYATLKDADAAVNAAAKAQAGWAALSAQSRMLALKALVLALKSQEENCVNFLTATTAVSEMQARMELQTAVKEIYHWICLADKVHGKLVGDGKVGSFIVSRQPLGVIAICGGTSTLTTLGPLMRLVSSALVLGNTVVLSATESNVIPALIIAQTLLLHKSLPPGVLNVITSGTEATLSAHPEVSSIWTGQCSATLSSSNFKRSWHLTEHCNLSHCPDEWLVYQATKLKTIAL